MNKSKAFAKNVLVISIESEITFKNGSKEIGKIIDSALDKGYQNLVLNLSKLKYMDSSGLGELVKANTKASAHHGALKLSDVPLEIKKLIQVTGLKPVFKIHNTVDEAINAF